MSNNPIGYSDPTGHIRVEGCTELAGGCDITQQTIDEDLKKAEEFRQTTNVNKCKKGNKLYCSYAENHPVETTTFLATGLVAGPLAENFLLGGGLSGLIDAAYLAAKPALMPLFVWLSKFFTHSSGSQTVSLGSFDQMQVKGYIEIANKASNNFTYFSMNPVVYRALNAVGLAKPINEGFMVNQISQSKNFAVTIIGEAGSGTLMEMQMLAQSAYTKTGALLEGITYFFTHQP